MKSMTLRGVLSCCVAVAVLGVNGPVTAQADDGCPNDLVPRNAGPGDQVCVTKQIAAQVAQENSNAANLREPNGGAYGPETCKPGYVWREAFAGDAVCVTPDQRQQTWNQNAAAPPAEPPRAGPPGPQPAPAPQAPAPQAPAQPEPQPQPQAPGCDPRVDVCVH
jgi:hypothetical protein